MNAIWVADAAVDWEEADARWDWEWISNWGLLSGALDATAQINAPVQRAAHAGRCSLVDPRLGLPVLLVYPEREIVPEITT